MTKIVVVGLVAAAAAVGLARAGVLDLGFGGGDKARIEGVEVKRGPLRISVLERANLKAANSVKLKCELEGRSTILWLIEEGAIVAPGDLVCQLDTSSQMERKVEQEISVQNAEAAWVKAKQNLAIQESQNESDLKKAEQELGFADQDLKKYVEGEYPQTKQAESESILLAESDLALKRNEFEWSRKLAEKGFLERTRLDLDEFSFKTAEIKLEQARRSEQLLEEFDHPRRMLELRGAIDEARRELDRVVLQAKARITDFDADVRTSEAKFNLERDELVKLLGQIEKAEMRAPVGGMVVYAKESGGRWGGGEPIQEGTEVRERQDIITIPSSHGMIAEMSLHESVLEKVREGMPCVITVEAVRGRQFTGRVRFKSTLPDQNSWMANPDLRVYRTEITFVDTDPDLKSGMSCNVEVVVQDLVDALHIPVQSVFLNRGEPVCFVSDGGKVAIRAIEVGLDNGKWVEVLGGLAEHEIVLLAQPPGFTLQAAEKETVGVDAVPPLEGSEGYDPGAGGRGMEGGRPSMNGDGNGAPGRSAEKGGRSGFGARPAGGPAGGEKSASGKGPGGG
jgi:HlyD family secretion protein